MTGFEKKWHVITTSAKCASFSFPFSVFQQHNAVQSVVCITAKPKCPCKQFSYQMPSFYILRGSKQSDSFIFSHLSFPMARSQWAFLFMTTFNPLLSPSFEEYLIYSFDFSLMMLFMFAIFQRIYLWCVLMPFLNDWII